MADLIRNGEAFLAFHQSGDIAVYLVGKRCTAVGTALIFHVVHTDTELVVYMIHRTVEEHAVERHVQVAVVIYPVGLDLLDGADDG